MKQALTRALSCLVFLSCIFGPQKSHAWGRRGHSIICQTAAYLVAKDPKADFMKMSSFDLGYYCNVPDLIWKKPMTYEMEWFNHFMDMEIFEREFKKSKIEKPFELDRASFNSAFPGINNAAGRAFWRIRELMGLLEKTSAELKKPNLAIYQRHDTQTEWLVLAGAMGHYVGDLSQPLHVTENYDGQLTGQKGIHGFFEDDLVNELFHDGSSHLESDVMKSAEAKWNKEQKALAKKSVLEIIESLANTSSHDLPALLAADKKVGRSDLKKAAAAHRAMILDRLTEGAVALAELYRRETGWDFNAKNFHGFDAAPEFIAPPKVAEPSPAPAPSPTPAPTAVEKN